MAYNLYFWRQTSSIEQSPESICDRLCADEEIDGVAYLGVADIKKRFAEEFPEIEDYGAEMNCSLAGSYFLATWPITSRPGQTQAIYVECGFTLLKSPETLNRIIDVGRGLGCALYDPQTGQRYPQP